MTYRQVRRIVVPAILDGGDVLRLDRAPYIGTSTRSNPKGVE